MPRTNGAKMPVVQGDDGLDVQPLRERDDRGIGTAQGEVAVLRDKLNP